MSPKVTSLGRSLPSVLQALIALSVLFCVGISPASAATLTVSSLNDSGAGTLRGTITAAVGGDEIVFSVTGTITLTSGIIEINKNLTITGPDGGIVISGNNASGMIKVTGGTVTLSKLTLTDGNAGATGGGLWVSGGELTLDQCTISGNTAVAGGGIYNTGTLSMTNCTVSGNTASSGNGGGIYNIGSSFTMFNCTVTQNSAPFGSGGGLYNVSTSTDFVLIVNTIISENTAASNISVANPGGANFASSECSLVGNNPGGIFDTDLGNIVSNAPGLGPLADNGGPTKTHALLSGSPAIDAGISSGAPPTDQRGINRPQGSATDIGAYELESSGGASNTPPAANAQYVSLPKDGNKTVGITLSGSDQEGDSLTYSVVRNPSAGTLSGTPPNLTYTWNVGTTYADSFTFRAYDGYHYSAPATVRIEAVDGPSNMPAVPHNKVVSTPSGTAKSITLSGSNFEGTSFTYTISQTPSHGTLSGTAPNITYTPTSGYTGADIFYYSVKDSDTPDRSSEPAWVYIYVGVLSVPGLPPVADAGPDKEAKYETTLDGSRSFDPAGRTLTYLWSSSGSGITFGSPGSPSTNVTKGFPGGSGTFTATLTVTNTDSKTASDTVEYKRTPGYDHLSMILLALFWALIGLRYIRKGAAQKR